MVYLRLYDSLDKVIGTSSDTPHVGMVKGSDIVIFASEDNFNRSVNLIEDSDRNYYKCETMIPPNNEIWYTTTDGNVFNFVDPSVLDVENDYNFTLVSNTYTNGKGVMVFDRDITMVGAEVDEDGNVTNLGPIFMETDSEGNMIDSRIRSIILPSSLQQVNSSAFLGCTNMKFISLPNSVNLISSGAFRGCSSLEKIKLSDSITIIASNCFYGCSGIKILDIPDNVTSIGDYAFYNCSGLTRLTIPSSVTSIGKYAITPCPNLYSIRFKGTKEQWESITKGYHWYYGGSVKKIVCSDGNIDL